MSALPVSSRRHLRRAFALLAFALLPVRAGAQAAPAGSCVRYVYADTAHAANDAVPFMACTDIVHNTAVNCHRIGSMNTKKMQAAEEKAKNMMAAYGLGMLAAVACTLTIDLGPYFLPRTAYLAVNSSRITANNVTAEQAIDAAYHNDRNGTRIPGDEPSKERGEEFKSIAHRMCSHVKKAVDGQMDRRKIDHNDSFNLGVESVLNMFATSAAHAAVLKGDARYIWSLPPKDRRAAYEKMQAKVREIGRRQAEIMERATRTATSVYRFMTDNSLRTVPFGTSPEGVSDQLKCAPNTDILKLRASLCTASVTLAELEGYFPGDLYQPGGQQAALSQLARVAHEGSIQENCMAASPATDPLLTRMGENSRAETPASTPSPQAP